MELKRLSSVASVAGTAASYASAAYAAGSQYVPERLRPAVESAEGAVASLATPYVTLISDKSASALQAVDAKVDSAIAAAWQSYESNTEMLSAAVEKQRVAQAANLEHFAAARQQYLKRVEESVAFVREQGLQGTSKVAADVLLARVEEARRVPAVVLTEISEAWGKFYSMPAVERLLAASKASVDAAWVKYQGAHGALVASPTYSAAVSKGGDLLASLQSSLQSSSAYQAAAGRLTPLLAPYAEGAAKVAGPYVAAVAGHLAPVAAAH